MKKKKLWLKKKKNVAEMNGLSKLEYEQIMFITV